MTETKQCSKCKVFRTMDGFKEGRKQCNVCLESKRRHRERHKEEISIKYKEYYDSNREKLNEKADCPLCKCYVKASAMKRHEQSMKHQMKIKGTTNHQNNNRLST